MKSIIEIATRAFRCVTLTVGLATLAVSAIAGTPTYKTITGNGNAATPAQVNIPEDPNLNIRIVDITYTSDTNIATLVMKNSQTAIWQTATNVATSSVTNQVSTTNGLSGSTTLAVLNHNGTLYTNTVLTWNSSTNTPVGPYGGTNIVLATGGWGVAASVGDNIYLIDGSTATRYVGSGTNGIDGEAIFTGNQGRPMTVGLSPASTTNRLSVTVRYE